MWQRPAERKPPLRVVLGELDQFFRRLTLLPTGRSVAKDKVISGVKRLLEMSSPVVVFQSNGRGLIPELYDRIVMLSLEQSGTFLSRPIKLNPFVCDCPC
jgi:hypothetical protein